MGSVEELFKTSLQPPVPASVHLLLAQLQLLCPPPLLLHPNPVTLLRLQLRRVWCRSNMLENSSSLKMDPGSDPTLDVMFLVWYPGILLPRT